MPSNRWRVVWARDEVMLIFCPTSLFSSVDLPAFGRPASVTRPLRVVASVISAIQQVQGLSRCFLLGMSAAVAFASHGPVQYRHMAFDHKILIVRFTGHVPDKIGRCRQGKFLQILLEL